MFQAATSISGVKPTNAKANTTYYVAMNQSHDTTIVLLACFQQLAPNSNQIAKFSHVLLEQN